MPAKRPVECPACGHEYLHRRSRSDQIADGFAAQRPDEWVCGLCRYEWDTMGGGRSSARKNS